MVENLGYSVGMGKSSGLTPNERASEMSKENSKYEYSDFYFLLVDANGYDYQVFDPNSQDGLGGNYEVAISASDFDYQVFTIHSAVRELTKFVKHHGNFTMGKDFFIKTLEITVFNRSLMGHTNLGREELENLKALINPKLIWTERPESDFRNSYNEANNYYDN
jgi:hypothetical protein